MHAAAEEGWADIEVAVFTVTVIHPEVTFGEHVPETITLYAVTPAAVVGAL